MERNPQSESSLHQINPEAHERQSDEFQTALAQITAAPATVELLRDNAYTKQAMTQLLALNEQVGQTFKKAGRQEVFASDRDREDAAFRHFNLPNLADILDQVSQFNEKLQQLDQLLQNNKQQDLLIEKVKAVFVPTDEKAIHRGKQDKELVPKLIIDRTKAILVTLSQNFNIDVFDPNQLKITEGEITDNMMRQTPYRFLDIPTLQRQILVNDEEGNATFVFDSTKLQQLQISSQQLSEAMSKSELKTLIEQHPGIGQTLAYTQNFIERLIKAIEQPASKSRKHKATKENADYLQTVESAPEGWMNTRQLTLHFNIGDSTLKKAIDNLANLESATYKSSAKQLLKYYSPTAIEEIRQELGDKLTTQKAPEGWMTAGELASYFGISHQTLTETLGNITNLKNTLYKDAKGRIARHYSPATIEEIRQELGDKLTSQEAPEGWMNLTQLVTHFGTNSRTLNNAIDKLNNAIDQSTNLETQQYKTSNGLVRNYYSPATIEQIKQKLGDKLTAQKAPEGWMNIKELALYLGISTGTMGKTISKLTNLETQRYKDNGGHVIKYYAIEQITKKLAEQRENK